MKIFIWENNGISDAYHDDGTLVVLAHDAAEARNLMLTMRRTRERDMRAWNKERDAYIEELKQTGEVAWQAWTRTERGADIWERCPEWPSQWWDGREEALAREPDRVVELDKPTWVAFNGGGYD